MDFRYAVGMKSKSLLILVAIGVVAIAAVLFLTRGGPETPKKATVQAFTSQSYADYLGALAESELPTSPGPRPSVEDYLRTFTLERPAKEPERIEGDPDSWTGTVAAYALENDPTPSVWVVKTTLEGELEGTLVLSDTDNPL